MKKEKVAQMVSILSASKKIIARTAKLLIENGYVSAVDQPRLIEGDYAYLLVEKE